MLLRMKVYFLCFFMKVFMYFIFVCDNVQRICEKMIVFIITIANFDGKINGFLFCLYT